MKTERGPRTAGFWWTCQPAEVESKPPFLILWVGGSLDYTPLLCGRRTLTSLLFGTEVLFNLNPAAFLNLWGLGVAIDRWELDAAGLLWTKNNTVLIRFALGKDWGSDTIENESLVETERSLLNNCCL